ncbi:hypothetical protein B296_00008109 [Ensete ventricosum]|uniref:Uncharacterized protein n=1 Tax=Ensete ventricosum TaxID=4639 RepID=A0A427AMY7_ENSVE|nr:hypothetical protein B296_00008109 [Ensete ventricosum]
MTAVWAMIRETTEFAYQYIKLAKLVTDEIRQGSNTNRVGHIQLMKKHIGIECTRSLKVGDSRKPPLLISGLGTNSSSTASPGPASTFRRGRTASACIRPPSPRPRLIPFTDKGSHGEQKYLLGRPGDEKWSPPQGHFYYSSTSRVTAVGVKFYFLHNIKVAAIDAGVTPPLWWLGMDPNLPPDYYGELLMDIDHFLVESWGELLLVVLRLPASEVDVLRAEIWCRGRG